MDFKKYFSDSQLVEIAVVKIGNQKITKSILNQLPIGRKVKFPFQMEDLKILGFVNDNEGWIIYTENEKAFKQSLSRFTNFLKTGVENQRISDISDYIHLSGDYDSYDGFEQLNDEDKSKFLLVFNQTKLFYRVLKSHQIFI